MNDKILSEVSAIMGERPATEIARGIVNKYWPGPMTWEEIVSRVRSWSDGPISRDEAYEVMHVASLLGVFGFPEGSQFREEKRVDERDTKFRGFANALIDDLRRNVGMNNDERLPYTQLIARRAYDLACHVIDESIGGTATEIVKCVPDLTKLPEEPK